MRCVDEVLADATCGQDPITLRAKGGHAVVVAAATRFIRSRVPVPKCRAGHSPFPTPPGDEPRRGALCLTAAHNVQPQRSETHDMPDQTPDLTPDSPMDAEEPVPNRPSPRPNVDEMS